MRTSNAPKKQQTNIVTGPVKNDLNVLQQHVKQLEAQIKRLAEAVRANRLYID